MYTRGIVGVLIRPLFSRTVKVGLEKHIIKKRSNACCYKQLFPSCRIPRESGSAGVHNQVYKYQFFKCRDLTRDNIGDYVELHGKILFKKGRKFILGDESGTVELILSENDKKKWMEVLRSGTFVKVTGIVQEKVKWKSDVRPSQFTLAVSVNDILSVSVYSKNIQGQSKNNLNLELLPEELSRCSPSSMHYFFRRTHNTAALREDMLGQNVKLCGWVHTKHDDNVLTLQDGHGSVLVKCSGEIKNLIPGAEDVDVNDLIFVEGVVAPVSELPNHVGENGQTIHVSAMEVKVIKDLGVESFGTYIGDKKEHASKSQTKEVVTEIRRTEKNEKTSKSSPDFNRYTLRSHNCGEINESLLGQTVRLMGWALYVRMNKFILLRDKYGTIQLIVPDSRRDLQKLLESLLPESVISVVGKVSSRPRGLENKFMKSGVFEVCVEDMQIISRSAALPLHSKSSNPSKHVLLKYRYLDLRHNLTVQKSLQMRCDVLHNMRKFLVEDVGFLEVETPTLFRRTPGGAQEFIVPTRNKGEFYSLVQSPQQFKQLLMVSGADRYFQIARCYRDETGQRDRQPEFTQLDVEMSFCDREGVLNLIEDLIKHIWPHDSSGLVTPFPRLTFEEAMATYGSDKPDTRFGCKIIDVTEAFRSSEANGSGEADLNSGDFAAYTFVIRNGTHFVASLNNAVQEKKENTNIHLFVLEVNNLEYIQGTLDRIFKCKSIYHEFRNRVELNEGDAFVLGLGPKMDVLKSLGEIRAVAGNLFNSDDVNVIDKDGFHFAWILDFPLFELVDGQMKSVHHPFTQPHPDDVHMLRTEPLKVRSLHYDLVLNGSEIGGGSIRIHDAALQKEVLENFLKLDPSPLRHLLEALESGAPVHGGFALGIDRFIAHLCRLTNINDVIAFPKSTAGRDAMSGAPCQISDEEKLLYHISLR